MLSFISEDGLTIELEPPHASGPGGNAQPAAAQTGYNTYQQNSFENGQFAYKVHDETYSPYYTV